MWILHQPKRVKRRSCELGRGCWFLARVPESTIDTAGFTENEKALIVGHRWWTLDELAAATDRLVPANLAALVQMLLRDGPSATPFDL